MKKLIYLIFLLPFFAYGQGSQVNGTIQRNATTGVTRYYNSGAAGIDTLQSVTGMGVNGYVLVYNSTLKKSVWTNPTGFGTNFWQRSGTTLSPATAGDDILTTGNIQADSIKRTGGTGAQFLMGNGSIQDTTTIQTVANFFPKGDTRYVTTSTNQTIGGFKTFNNSVSINGSSGLQLYNSGNTFYSQIYAPPTITGNWSLQTPNASGVLALTSDLLSYVPTSRTITAGFGLSGGGDLSANRTISADTTGSGLSSKYLRLSGGDLTGLLRVKTGSSNTSSVEIGTGSDNATISSKYSTIVQIDNTNTIGNRMFSVRYGGYGYSDGTELMRLDLKGIAVKTTDLTSALSGSASVNHIYDGNVSSFKASNPSTIAEFYSAASEMGIYGSTNDPYKIYTNSTERFKIDGDGNTTSTALSGGGNVIAGADNTGLLKKYVVGSGLSLSNDTLKATGGSSGFVTTSGMTSGRLAVATSASDIATTTALTLSGSNLDVTGSVSVGGDIQVDGTYRDEDGEALMETISSVIRIGSAGAISPRNVEIYSGNAKAATFGSDQSLNVIGPISGSNLAGTNSGDQTITLTGAVTGSGTSSFPTTLASEIDATKIADGTVTSTEFQYINTLSSNAQTQLDAKSPLNSPTFTGTPSLPTGTIAVTQTQGDNSTKIATTAYVDALGNTILGAQKQISNVYTNTSTLTTSMENLITTNIPQSALSSNGDRVDFEYTGSFGIGAADKFVTLLIGGNTIPVSGNASNKSVWSCKGYLMRTSSTTFRLFITNEVDNVYTRNFITSDYVVTDFNPLPFIVQGQTNSAGQGVIVQMGYIEAKKAP